MATKKGGLGKGFNSLFIENSVDEISAGNADKIKLIDIVTNKEQPRKVFDDEKLNELAQSISQHGVIQPILVRPLSDGTYQIVAGERRWRASRMAGLSEIPAVVREMTQEEAMAIALIENLQREDLNPIEESEGIKLLIDKFELTQEEISKRLGKSRSSVTNALRILKLPDEVKNYVENGIISTGHAKAILSLESEEKIIEIAKLIINKNLSVRETEALVKKLNSQKPTKQKQTKKRDIFYDEVELALSESLGRKIQITCVKDKGSIKIEFFDRDDLKKIIKNFE
ncbi:MAG: ParB/RepB/Spo0J family partition protein [Clostridia bacterium]|nr:ParB/RepB/Spo0J family partition protein [Clostridia bacterium]